MIRIIPITHPDQSFQSIAAHIWVANAFSAWTYVARATFGGGQKSAAQMPFHSGIAHCFAVLNGMGASSAIDLLAKHGFLIFFKPFLSEATYQWALDRILSDRPNNLSNVLGIQAAPLLTPISRYCPECAREEIAAYGYAYAHRVHQLRCVELCPDHGCSLTAGAAGELSPVASHGILGAIEYRRLAWTTTSARAERSAGRGARRLANWARLALAGEIPLLPREPRLRLIGDMLAQTTRTDGSLESRLQRVLTDTYGKAYLERIGLPLNRGTTAYWPGLFIAGTAYADNALANLLVLVALNDSPGDMAAILRELPSRGDANAQSVAAGASRIRFRVAPSLSILKSLLGVRSFNRIGQLHRLGSGTVAQLANALPAVMRRRPEALRRARRRQMRRQLERFLAFAPHPNRERFERSNRAACHWLRNNDADWFNEKLPAYATRQS